MMDENKGKVKSLLKAIDILDVLSQSTGGLSLSELSERCGYPKSTVHALASTMRDRGLLRQLPDGAYALGIRLFEYGSAVSRGFDISKLVRPYLESLSALTGANSVITMLDGHHPVSIDYAVSASGVQASSRLSCFILCACEREGRFWDSAIASSRSNCCWSFR